MARTFTRLELRTRLRQLCDIENDQHVTDTELNGILDSANSELWDLICDSGLGEKYVKSVTFNTVANQLEYPLATVTGGDFYRIADVYTVENNTQLRKLTRIQPSEILYFKAPQTTIPMKLYYIPYAPKMTQDTDTVDGENGWEEFLLMTAACAVKVKREEDYSRYANRKAELRTRIKALGNVDHGEPARVARKRSKMQQWPWGFFQNNVNAYGVRGDKLEVYYLSGYTPGS